MMESSYRLYMIREDGGICGAANRNFAGDREAVDHARTFLALHPAVEVWQTDRMVGRVSRPGSFGEPVAA